MRARRANCLAIFAFVLLLAQMSVPWTVKHFVTEDGPSHLYNAGVARSLLLNPDSPFAEVYDFNARLVPNWGSAIAMGAIASVVGFAHAEQVFVSLAICAGFFAFSYALRAAAPGAPRWTPLANFIVHTWFVWLGFHNFYLAMALCPLAIGFYLRHARELTATRALLLAAGVCGLYLTHLIPAAVAAMTIGITAAWVHFADARSTPAKFRSYRSAARAVGTAALALAPTAALFALFVRKPETEVEMDTGFQWALEGFPMHVFTTSFGRAGNQVLLFPAVLALIVFAILGLRRREWKGLPGGLTAATIGIFLVYLLVPDAGLGGKEAKIRFAWGVFVVGALVLWSASRMRRIQLFLGMYIFALMIPNLYSTVQATRRYSRAVEDYLAAAAVIPRGARIVRLRYPTPDIPERYGFEEIGRDPLFHLDAYAAAQCGCLDLSDYQAPNRIFPVVFDEGISARAQSALWSLEGPGADTAETLAWLRKAFPAPIDYVILMADSSTPGMGGPDFARVLSNLNSGMQLAATSPRVPFVRVYRRTGAR